MGTQFNYTFGFGNFGSWCSSTPTLAVCNLFYRRLLVQNNMAELGYGNPADAIMLAANISSAGVGVNPGCSIPRRGHSGSLGNVGLIVACCFSMVFVGFMTMRITQRIAAVARQEMRVLFMTYLAMMPLQIITMSSLLEQGGKTLVIVTSIQESFQSAFFWSLLACAVVMTQVVEDGSGASLWPLGLCYVAVFTMTLVASLDVPFDFVHFALHYRHQLYDLYDPILYTITFLIPLVGTTMYALLITYVTLGMLQEFKPFAWSIVAGMLWSASLLVNFLWSADLCHASKQRLDGAFLAVMLQSTSMWALFQAWQRMTESEWGEDGNQTIDAFQHSQMQPQGNEKGTYGKVADDDPHY
ncbi:unnamed protein product [Tilletia controversa]|uniref:Chitin synthase export chaperone n=3 Tax=Tilletia TaxID=13289 RepID=A0A8X7MXA4_9BASI|nr:hypothetical protein CF336_g2149 [Tilletia laevis]KAE8202777.1 hypothetical protein CF328_g2026 [Tilletia controversa]KAE8263479.1 hypothetical protein A4X03_0g1651 [Tilletia caries]KAE8207059.1 hypothetical protein CF335_g1425 [Tilletia laevis]KAE8251825.1 hypothetical protein A4X06_0g2516 [Tilletia controversa]